MNLPVEPTRIALALSIAFGGTAAAWLLAWLLGRTLRHSAPASALLLRRVLFWGLVSAAIVSALQELGVDLSLFVGAAGILTVAVGFASQTSASNVISGVFLLTERPFGVGDSIRIGTTTGVVLSIDLLSVKLRTFDNLFVRIPNETVMKSEIVNLTRFPVRRFDLLLRIDRSVDVARVQELLVQAADACPQVLDEPRPIVIFQGYGDAGIELQLSAWSQTERFLELRNALPAAVDTALREAGVPVGIPVRRMVDGPTLPASHP